MKKIMFICTGNICRSAMAEKLLKKKIEDKNLAKDFLVFSSGLYAYLGDVSTYEAIKIMKDEYQIDLSTHRATPTSSSNIQDMDLILVMTKSHKDFVINMYPNLAQKVFLLREYVGLDGDILDPYGGNLKIYSDCASELNECINLLLKKEAEK